MKKPALHLYNTLTKRKELFAPQNDATVTMYTCGPTVYNYPHIGNFKAFMTADVLTRTLRALGYDVHSVMNITDVGHLTDDDVAQGDSGRDKMEAAAVREGKTPQEIAQFYEEAFRADSEALHLLPPREMPRATQHIDAMIAMIQTLLDRGHAYDVNGNVFYDVTTFAAYGALSGNTLEQLKVGARLSERHPDKRNQWDFALWLKAPENHIMKWSSPWSIGYPGWHIECSAMSTHYLGDTLDIHLGGEDHIFPHHEAEIAQSEGATQKPFVRYWVHTRHMLVDGTKMSKSKGNFYTLATVRERGFDPEDLRVLYLLSHYRSQMNFTWDALAQAAANRKSLRATAQRLRAYAESGTVGTETLDTQLILTDFFTALADDLNTPHALAVTLSFLSQINSMIDSGSLANADEASAVLEQMNAIIGVTLTPHSEDIPAEIRARATQRDAARAAKDFATADRLRDEIIAAGYTVTDTLNGTRITR